MKQTELIAMTALVLSHVEAMVLFFVGHEYYKKNRFSPILGLCIPILLFFSLAFCDIAKTFYRKLGVALLSYLGVVNFFAVYLVFAGDVLLLAAYAVGATGFFIILFDEIARISRGSPM